MAQPQHSQRENELRAPESEPLPRAIVTPWPVREVRGIHGVLSEAEAPAPGKDLRMR